MVFRVVDRDPLAACVRPAIPELAGARVLLSGVGPACGADLVMAFADHGARVLVQIADRRLSLEDISSNPAATVLEIPAPDAHVDGAAAARMAQRAARTFGSLDVAVHVIAMEPAEPDAFATPEALEDAVARRLSSALRSTSVIANRMGLTWTPGLVLNVLRLDTNPASDELADPMLQLLVRDALATATRVEARRWAAQGVRINAVIAADGASEDASPVDPIAAAMNGEQCVEIDAGAAGALAGIVTYLASDAGAALTGQVFEA